MPPGNPHRCAPASGAACRGVLWLWCHAGSARGCGGGVIASKASAALQTLAEFLQAPVLTTAEGKGALSDRHPLALGAMRLRQDPIVEYLAQTDIVLAVGTRLAFGATASAPACVSTHAGRKAVPDDGIAYPA